MAEQITVHVEPAPVFDLDPAHIGMALMLLVSASANLGHAEPLHTLHYGAPEGEPLAAQFVRDVFELTTEEIAGKWYGGRLGAARLSAEVNAAALRHHRELSALPAL